eukprot:c53430_g1_i1.p1 GENE.c53430_g1_i1~~c53430_g1_i1.p1  ORF type:complete len:331 (+),score=79.80 c53430_g1_i1:45-995(+)
MATEISAAQTALGEFEMLMKDLQMSAQVAVIRVLTTVVKNSKARTMMELEREVRVVVSELMQRVPDSYFAVSSGSELFVRSFTRPKIEIKDIEDLKSWVVRTTESVVERAMRSRSTIADLFNRFVGDNMTILTISHSRVVMECLARAAKQKRLRVLVTESKGSLSGMESAHELQRLGIPVTLILDSAVAFHMKRVDAVIVGAEAIAESGGSIARPGAYQTAILAREFNTPFYIACESYKFARIYPLAQGDLPNPRSMVTTPGSPASMLIGDCPEGLQVSVPRWEYTPPKFITLLFTDLGVLTPSAVSDELIKMYLD